MTNEEFIKVLHLLFCIAITMVPYCGSMTCHSDYEYCGKETITFQMMMAVVGITDLTGSTAVCTPLVRKFRTK